MSLAQGISFVVGLVLLLAGWLMLSDPRRFIRCLGLSQASLGTLAALGDLLKLEWVLLPLVLVALAIKPHPSVLVARFVLSIMAGLTLAGIAAS